MKKKIIFAVTSAIVITTMSFDVMTPTGEEGKTGSPGEKLCNECHKDNALNAAGGSVTIASPNLTNWQYALGQTYTISVTVARTNMKRFGLGFEALTSTGANAGTLTAGTGTKLLTFAANSRVNIVQNGSGNTGTGTFTFTFTWKAPATNVGNVTFYCAGNAANGSQVTGDFIYSTTQVVTPTTVGVNEVSLANQITVFPNPATDRLQISNPGNKSGNMMVSIMDLKGELIRDKQLIHTNDFIELNELNSGSYLLHIETDGKVAIKKFIKQ